MRNKRNVLNIIVAVGFVMVALFSSAQLSKADAGVGASPSNFEISNALKGGEYEKTITVFNTGDEDGYFGFNASGEGGEWFSFYKADDPDTLIEQVHIKAHEQERILLKIMIAEDATNMVYNPTIYVFNVPPEIEGEGSVSQAVVKIPVQATIQVTGTQILVGTVRSITTTDTETGYLLKIKVEFKNEGNVVAKPSVAVNIKKNGNLIDTFTYDETGVKPNKREIITVSWNTSGHDIGSYVADADVSLGGDSLANKDLSFEILAYGTLTRRGELCSLTIEGEPAIGIIIRVHANFKNTGEIDTRAKFEGEVYHNNELVDTVSSNAVLIEVGEDRDLTSYYKVTTPGNYLIKGHVFYEGKETNEKTISFSIQGEGGVKDKGTFSIGSTQILIVTTLIIGMIVGTMVIMQYRKD